MSAARTLAARVCVLLCCGMTRAWAAPEGDASRGATVAGLAGCIACHTDETLDDPPLGGGGHVIETAFGEFRGTNITPSDEYGIGRWSYEDFNRAIRFGISPDKKPYYPSFPFTSFAYLSDQDVADLWAWLRTLPPSDHEPGEHTLARRYQGRGQLRLWRGLGFRRGPLKDDPDRSEAWNRGRYLVTAPGHCGECHTPRTSLGVLRRARALQGWSDEHGSAPDISPSPEHGIGAWSLSDLEDFLEMGMLPDGDFTGGGMTRVVEEGTSQLRAEDRRAMALYLLNRDAP